MHIRSARGDLRAGDRRAPMTKASASLLLAFSGGGKPGSRLWY